MRKIVITNSLVAALLFCCAVSSAALPDTLDFVAEKFVRTGQMLLREPVKYVSIARDGKKIYPSAVFTVAKAVFLDQSGRTITESKLPGSRELMFAQSANGKFIYVHGPLEKRSGQFHRLYLPDGRVVFSREDSARMGILGLGLPLENGEAFLLAASGKVSLTKFDGERIAEAVLLDRANFEDGDIYSAEGEGKIYAVANKYLLPTGRGKTEGPKLYVLDSRLRETARDTLPLLLATSLQASPDGRYVAVRAELEDGTSPYVIYDSKGTEKLRLDNSIGIGFSENSRGLIYAPHVGDIKVYSLETWQPLLIAQIPHPRFSWVDYALSGDATRALLFDTDQLVLLDISHLTWSKADFPFSFTRCFLDSGGNRMILTGEFGFCVYDLVPQ